MPIKLVKQPISPKGHTVTVYDPPSHSNVAHVSRGRGNYWFMFRCPTLFDAKLCAQRMETVFPGYVFEIEEKV
jgi:hypothetical protein